MISNFGKFGSNLQRPEGVLAQSEGVWCSDASKGLKFIGFDGSERYLGHGINEANGFWPASDGSFFVAGLQDGFVWRIAADGTTSKVELLGGRPLGSPNAVCEDGNGRLWVSIQTANPNWVAGLNTEPDGYIILKDGAGSRIVADRIHCANELKVSRDGRWLYCVETLGHRILRFAIGDDGSLGEREVYVQLDVGAFPDGIVFDEYDRLWTTLLLRNGIAVIGLDRKVTILYEDAIDDAVDAVVNAVERRDLQPEMFGACLTGGPLQLPTSIAFGGPDGRTGFVGSLIQDHLVTFDVPRIN